MTFTVVLLIGAMCIMVVRLWVMHLAIVDIAATLTALNQVDEALSTRISYSYDYALEHHDTLTKASTLITGIGGSITAAFREIKKISAELGATNARVHDLEIGLSEAIPNIKESLMRAHEKLVRDGARINDLETRQDPKRYVDGGVSYGGTD